MATLPVVADDIQGIGDATFEEEKERCGNPIGVGQKDQAFVRVADEQQ